MAISYKLVKEILRSHEAINMGYLDAGSNSAWWLEIKLDLCQASV